MSDITISIKQMPNNPTKFRRGDVLAYPALSVSPEFIVIGEDDLYLHTIMLGNGNYYGVLKREPNLTDLEVRRPKQFSDGFHLTAA